MKGSDSPPDSFRPIDQQFGAHNTSNAFSTAQAIRSNGNNHLGVYSPFEPRNRLGGNPPIGVSAPVGNGPLSSRLFMETQGNTIFNQYEKWSSAMDPSSLGALSLADPGRAHLA